MASPNDLVTLAQLKASIGQQAVSGDDAALGMLITSMSRAVLSFINRGSVLPKSFTMTMNGNGKTAQMLPNFPVISVESLIIDGQVIPQCPAMAPGVAPSSGFMIETCDPEPPGSPVSMLLRGFHFRPGIQNVAINYRAGYQVTDEPVIAGVAVTVEQPFGAWGSDVSVTYADTGVALTRVKAAPTAGQYQIDDKIVGGYKFSDADANAALLITYGYVPADLGQAILDWIADRYAYRGRVGQQSKTLGGQETVSFAIKDIPAFVKLSLQQYCRVSTF